MRRPRHILPTIIGAQFAGTALWFAGNAVIDDLGTAWDLPRDVVGTMTSAVQQGFILGTLLFAFLALADRFSPRRVFLVCSLAGAGANAALVIVPESMTALLLLRFVTGVFLAFLLLWGATVSSDSPQFSALNAANAPKAYVGSILTLVNALGFLVTVVSIELLTHALAGLDPRYLFLLLAPGPLIGLWFMRPLIREGR